MRAGLVLCETHEAAKRLALAAIMIYPVGISVLYIIAFAYARPAIRESRPTRLTQAIAFLSSDFESDYMWWEARFCMMTTGPSEFRSVNTDGASILCVRYV